MKNKTKTIEGKLYRTQDKNNFLKSWEPSKYGKTMSQSENAHS